MNAKEVMIPGESGRGAIDSGLHQGRALFAPQFGKFDDQNSVFSQRGQRRRTDTIVVAGPTLDLYAQIGMIAPPHRPRRNLRWIGRGDLYLGRDDVRVLSERNE